MRATSLSVPEASVSQGAACSIIGDECKAYTSKQRLRRSCKTHPAGCLNVYSVCPDNSHDGVSAYGCQLASLSAFQSVLTAMHAQAWVHISCRIHHSTCYLSTILPITKTSSYQFIQKDFAVCKCLLKLKQCQQQSMRYHANLPLPMRMHHLGCLHVTPSQLFQLPGFALNHTERCYQHVNLCYPCRVHHSGCSHVHPIHHSSRHQDQQLINT